MPPRRWLQFSIRTALLLVTLLCVGLRLWVSSAERRRRAVAAIDSMGGTVTYVDSQTTNESFPTARLRRWLPHAYLNEVEYVYLYGNAATEITDAGLANLQALTGMHGLWLGNTQVTDDGLAHLDGLSGLQSLVLYNTQITDDGLSHLEGLKALKRLWLINTQATDVGLTKLRKALPNCQIIGR